MATWCCPRIDLFYRGKPGTLSGQINFISGNRGCKDHIDSVSRSNNNVRGRLISSVDNMVSSVDILISSVIAWGCQGQIDFISEEHGTVRGRIGFISG